MTVGVYGLGRFGTFWAELLTRVCEVRVYSRNPAHPAPPGTTRVGEEELASLPAVFLCVAISAMEEVLLRVRARLTPGTLVMDTCSVKGYPVMLMEKLLPDSVALLGTHPFFGPDSAKNGTEGLPMILCPARIPARELSWWSELFASLGLRVAVMTPGEHDQEAALTQGITHYIGRVLSDFGVRPSPIATLGFKKLLEIVEQTCNDPWQLFLDLQRFNPYTREMRARLAKSLGSVLSSIDSSLDMPGAGGYDGPRNGAQDG